MFRILTALVFVAILVWIVRLVRLGRINNDSLKSYINRDFQSLAIFFSQPKSENSSNSLDILRKASLYLTFLLFLVLGLTGFLPKLLLGMNLSGWLLIIHVTVAPFFALSLTVLLLLWAGLGQFNDRDWNSIQQNLLKSSDIQQPLSDARFGLKSLFWLFMVISLPAILSVIFSMFPIFGTAGQHALLSIHQYSVLALTVILSIAVVWQISDKRA